jgi:integrase
MGRKRTGHKFQRNEWWYARVTTDVDNETIRPTVALGTKNETVAERKLQRLLAAEVPSTEEAKRAENFAELAERIYAKRIEEADAEQPGSKGPREELAQLRTYAIPVIGKLSALTLSKTDINSVLDKAKDQSLGRSAVAHLKQRMSNVFAAFQREPGGREDNPVEAASMPKFPETVVKERAVLMDEELAIYLAWEHPVKHLRNAVLERQTMACVARMFGGLRTGDLHALEWDALDVEDGVFAWGYASRKKTKKPQLLEVPEMLRPILQAWWNQAGAPLEGIVFPVRRASRLGDRVGEVRRNVSHAKAFRRDLQRAFAAAVERGEKAPAKGSRRWKQLFTETNFTLPIDFHSWRRAYAQALADADVTAQQAQALAGHADLGAHARYLRNTEKMRTMPAAALPRFKLRQKTNAIASTSTNPAESDSNALDALARKSMELHAVSTRQPLSGAEGRGFESPTARN